jgi:hypothetical protein
MEASMSIVPNPILRIEKYNSTKAKYARERDEITPRNGCELVAGVVARISGGPRQKELSLDDQVDHAKEVIAEYYEGPVELGVIATKGKGEDLQRPELAVIEQQLRSHELDLLICEDVGRVVRGAEAVRLCGIAVDQGTRVLAPNDCIDTDDPDWESDILSACRDHVGHNLHTSKRIKQKKQNRFRKFGGATPCEIAGYVKPEDAKTYDDWRKIDNDTPTIREGLRILKETLNCNRVADHFNKVGFAPGPHTRTKDGKWDGRMVRRFYKNMTLAGQPGRGYRHTIKHHEKGQRISVPNPEGPDFIECPHLAHVDYDELVAVNELLRERNSKRGRKKVEGVDPRWRVPKKTTVFPSQHARCWYCGYHFVRGANGAADSIMCCNAREWHCWNSMGVPCDLAATAVMGALNDVLNELEGFDAPFRELITQVHRERVGVSADQWKQLDAEDGTVARGMANLIDAMKQFGPTPEIKAVLDDLKQRQQQLARKRRALENLTKRELQLPSSIAEIRDVYAKKANSLAIESPEFGDLMRQLAPEFHVYLVRLLDGGHPMPRARVKMDLTGCFTDLAFVPGVSPLLSRVVALNLFVPPQRERIREDAVRLAASGTPQREIASRLSEPTFQTVVQKAIALNGMMKERTLTTPYEILCEPPADYAKLRRHKNARYQFKSMDGYERPQV